MESPVPHLAILPSPGMGHLIPLIEFAKSLVLNHRLTVTFLIPSDGPPSNPQKSVLNSLPSGIYHHFLPPVSFADLPSSSGIETIISLTITRSLPSLRTELKSMVNSNSNLVGLIVDLFGTDAFDIAAEFAISPYLFFPSTAMLLSFALFLPKLDETVSGEYRDLRNPIEIPGCSIPIQGRDLLDPVQDRKNAAYKWTLHNMSRYVLAEGIFLNSFPELEPGAIKYLQESKEGKPPVYPIGPLVKIDTNDEKTECLKWLDEQPNGSVLFVSFGSGGTLSSVQINELAMGLEMSGQRFIWVVRKPSHSVANGNYFGGGSENDPSEYLPEGFIERTKNRGLVVPNWGPQARILRHGSTGGFLTHCGWNSSLESVVNGVPLIAWPLYAEQRMNAVMLTEEIAVALRPTPNQEDGIVQKEEISRVVKCLMEGEQGKKLRAKVKDLKFAAERAVGEDGSSTKAVEDLVKKWNNKIST